MAFDAATLDAPDLPDGLDGRVLTAAAGEKPARNPGWQTATSDGISPLDAFITTAAVERFTSRHLYNMTARATPQVEACGR